MLSLKWMSNLIYRQSHRNTKVTAELVLVCSMVISRMSFWIPRVDTHRMAF